MSQPIPTQRLTAAQELALKVLVRAAQPPGGGRARAGKRRSEHLPKPYVNSRAADSLVRLHLARRIDRAMERTGEGHSGASRWVGILNTDEYEVTAAGVALHSELQL